MKAFANQAKEIEWEPDKIRGIGVETCQPQRQSADGVRLKR